MKKNWKQITALLLVCMLLAMGGACGFSGLASERPTSAPSPSPLPAGTPPPAVDDGHLSVRFTDMAYARPDTERIRGEIMDLQRDIAAGIGSDKLLAAYADIYAAFNQAESSMSLAYLLYAFDVTEPYYEQEYAFLQSALNAIDLLMTEVSVQLFESSEEARRLAASTYGEAYITTVYEEESLNSEEIQALQNQEIALVNKYNRVSNEFTFTDGNGEIYTADELLSMPYDDNFVRLYDEYMRALNATVGEVYLDMVNVRAEIASKLGYGSYAAYMYDCYGRDYTLADAQRLQAAVKKYIVPEYLAAYGLSTTETYADADAAAGGSAFLDLFSSIRDVITYYTTEPDSVETGSLALYDATYPLAPFLDALRGAAADFSPKLYAPLSHMLQNELYDFSVNPNKMAGSFTTYISEYEAPFIFSQWENSSASIGTIIHELGHYTNYYRNPSVGWSAGDSLDLAEVDSQGLELLMIPYYERFYSDLAPYAERDLLINCMYALISGCMEDEFQQAVYADPSMTLSEMNDLYYGLTVAYGFDALYGYSGREWAEIPHTFQSPMYYISYAASMAPALSLWALSQTDPEAARAAYFKIVDRAPYTPFRTVIDEIGLPDAFSEKTIADIAAELRTRMQVWNSR